MNMVDWIRVGRDSEAIKVSAGALLKSAETFEFVVPDRKSDPLPLNDPPARRALRFSPRPKEIHHTQPRNVIPSPVNADEEPVDSFDDWRVAFVHVGQKSGIDAPYF